MSDKLTRADVVFSITILEDSIQHLNTMIGVENDPTKRYGSKCELSPTVAPIMKGRRDSLVRTVAWLRSKTEGGQP